LEQGTISWVSCSIYNMKKLTNRIEILSNEDLFDIIDMHTEVVVIAPWNGKPIPVTLRMLDSVALTSCGEFNTVSSVILDEDDKSRTNDTENVIKTKNIHENMLKLALVHPTFNELTTHLELKDFYVQSVKEIEDIKKLIDTLTSEEDKNRHRIVLNRLELSISFLVPEDFTAYIVTVLLQREATDLDKLTRNTLLQAGFLGEKYNTRPSSYIEGTFLPKQEVDIDVTALTLVADFREQQSVKSKGGMNWIRGGKK